MAQEFARVHDYYQPLHEFLLPSTSQYQQYELTQESASAASPYEVTSNGGAGNANGSCSSGSTSLVVPHASHHNRGDCALMQQDAHVHHNDTHKRKNSDYSSESFEMSGSEAQIQVSHAHVPSNTTRKRKSHISESFEMSGAEMRAPHAQSYIQKPANATTSRHRSASSYGTASTYDDDGGDDSKSSRTSDKKQNHSEIEKRRRDKMNTYISELSAMIPMCGAMARKLDKLTVLRMAVQHLRTIRGALSACPLSSKPRPAFISERELNTLILQAAHDSFLLVVGCDRGRLLYVSDSVKKMINYEKSELVGQSLFDILHPKDVAKVKEQLSSSDLSPRERLIDAKTMLPVKADMVAGASRLCPGARRSFYCRIKCKILPAAQNSTPVIKEEAEPAAKVRKKQNEKKYCVVQCTGYLKSWAPVEMPEGALNSESAEDGEASSLSCLVAVVRALPDLTPDPQACSSPPTRPLQYVSRHAPDGKFTFVDQRVTLVLGFLPQELLGTSLYEYVSGPELGAVARAHKSALLHRNSVQTPPYLFRKKDGTFARIQTHFKPFKNPWTKDVECLVANNSIVTEAQARAEMDAPQVSYDAMYQQKADLEMQRLIESQVESHKIGCAIADEALRRSSTPTAFSPDLPMEMLQDVYSQQPSLVDNILGMDVGYYQVLNNVPLSAAGAAGSPPPPGTVGDPVETSAPLSPPLPTLGVDGNGEAAMAVIMSLLEADAGLGDPATFSGLPWPLP